MEEEALTQLEPSSPIVSRSRASLETDFETQASTSTSTRLASRPEPEPKGRVGPWATRIQVILSQETAKAYQRYMADKNDLRPGAILGKILQEFLIQQRYLAKPIVLPPKCKHERGLRRDSDQYVDVCLKCGVRL